MKVVILAGGLGTRISEESHLRPKPMIEIGGMPILWHVMKIYSYYGFNEFIICCGYKGYMIKEYFADYYLHRSDITFDFSDHNNMIIHNNVAEPWKVTLVDTGLNTMTGGRIKRIKNYIGNNRFMMTYGDGVSDIDINKLIEYHEKNKKLATLTAIQLGARFGVIDLDNKNTVKSFVEKPKEDGGWINAGFMVLEPEVFDFIEGDNTIFEKEPLETLANQNSLVAYKHNGFWQCMDTQRDKQKLEGLWEFEKAPWKKWY
jgi:glucose-1-phosphate cytidylyltransferase